jgi:hypothetical protein
MPIDDATLNALATKAILESLTPEMKTELLARAVSHLFEIPEPERNHYGARDTRTRFQRSFDDALEYAQRHVVGQLLQSPEYSEKIRALIDAAVTQVFEKKLDLAELVTAAFSTGIARLREQAER